MMPESQDDLPNELHTWLRVAMLGLAESERAGLRETAIARFRETYARERSAGTPEAKARAAALRVLGNPWRVESKLHPPVDDWNRDVLEPVKNWLRRRRLPEPADVEGWLAIATFNLSDEARARVHAEIKGHYADALAAGRESGLSGEESAREALAALGPARQAARQFSKTYLTEQEENRIRVLKKKYRPFWTGAFKVVVGELLMLAGMTLWFVGLINREYFLSILAGQITQLAGIWLNGAGQANLLSWRLFASAQSAQRTARRYKKFISFSDTIFSGYFILLGPFLHWQAGVSKADAFDLIIVGLIFLIVIKCTRKWGDYQSLREKMQEIIQKTNESGPDQYA